MILLEQQRENDTERKKNTKNNQFEFFFYTTKCYISIDTSISNIRLKIITCNFAFECMAREHATPSDPNSNALSIFLCCVWLRVARCWHCGLCVTLWYLTLVRLGLTKEINFNSVYRQKICKCAPHLELAISKHWSLEIDYNFCLAHRDCTLGCRRIVQKL